MFGEFFQALAGNALVDWIFMLGLLGVGVGLLFGVAMRLAILSGSAMLFLMWLASLPLENNPLIDDHIVYIAVLAVLWFALPLQRLSASYKWRNLSFVKNSYWLK
jgi:thiosulfate dehydrogenase [quinone] large subunit